MSSRPVRRAYRARCNDDANVWLACGATWRIGGGLSDAHLSLEEMRTAERDILAAYLHEWVRDGLAAHGIRIIEGGHA